MGLVGRNMAVLLGGAAMTVLLGAQAGWAQETGQTDQTILVEGEAAQTGEQAAAPATSGATPLDKITIVSRTGEFGDRADGLCQPRRSGAARPADGRYTP